MRCIWSRHDPFVMWLMETLVDHWVVKSAVNEVDPEIGEREEERELGNRVPGSWAIFRSIVELCIATHFGHKEERGHDGHDRHSLIGLAHLHSNLVLQELGMLEGCLIEDEVV